MKAKTTIILLCLTCMLIILSACNRNNDGAVTHHADERYELISLILRLTREPFFSPTVTDFHHRLDYTFGRGPHLRHPVIELTRQQIYTWTCALFLAIHLQKDGDNFVFMESKNGLGNFGRRGDFRRFEAFDCPEMAARFLYYLNDFYREINFAAFFRENYEYFAEHSNRLREDVLNDINFEWFVQFGLYPANMNVFISHTFLVGHGIATWRYCKVTDEIIVYAAVPPSLDYGTPFYLMVIIHEFVHAFANYKSLDWLAENNEFYSWVATSYASPFRLGLYACFYTIAEEYATRAFTALYLQQHTELDLTDFFLFDMVQGFLHTQEVFALITNHEIIDLSVSSVLGIYEYGLGEKHSLFIRGWDGPTLVTWQFLDVQIEKPALENLHGFTERTEFGTKTGQVLYVTWGDANFVYVDLGSTEDFGLLAEPVARVYFTMPRF